MAPRGKDIFIVSLKTGLNWDENQLKYESSMRG